MPRNENVLFNREGLNTSLTINREAARNSLNRDTLQELLEAANEIAALGLEQCRTVTIRGAGDKAFVAGADIKLMAGASAGELNDFIALGQLVMKKFEELPQVVIACVDGFALGGGMELALACDLICATERAKFGQPEVNLGLIPGFGGTQRLGARVGIGQAKKLVFLGDMIDGNEAYRIGLADIFCASAELAPTVEKLVATLHSRGPHSIAAAKRAIQGTFADQQNAGLDNEVTEFVQLFTLADTREGLAAFIEKRAPQFTGRPDKK